MVISVHNIYQTTLKVCLANSHRDSGTCVSANTLAGRTLESDDDEDIATIELQGKAALWWTAAGTEKKTPSRKSDGARPTSPSWTSCPQQMLLLLGNGASYITARSHPAQISA